jgi:molybdenum cofactor synthesis domain-containing protein
LENLSFSILTISDTRDESSDESGAAIAESLDALRPARVIRKIVPDELMEISSAIKTMADASDAVFTTGGTGFSPRDVTPEATLPLLSRRAQGLEFLLTMRSLEETPFAALSRAVCGMRGKCLIVNLPGSPQGARCGMRALVPLLPHLFDQIRGGTH